MKRWLAVAPLVLVSALLAQDPERITVPFSNPSGPKRLECHLVNGNVTVKSHSGNDVIIEGQGTAGRGRRREPPPGMRRLEPTGTGLQVEESGNLVKIGATPARDVSLVISVPTDTSVKVSTVNNGNIVVEGVSGEIDANNLNGNVTVRNVSGAVVAHTLNGKLIATLNNVTPGKPMSFSTLNGDVDVTLPADVKANVKLKSDNGDIFTDFEITLKPNTTQPTGQRDSRGRYKLRMDRTTYGSLNGGGPDFSFTTLNGTIYIRKGK